MIFQETKEPKIGIIGIGYVGLAVETWFKSQGYFTLSYDKHKKIGSLEEANGADIFFLCLPTPYIEEGGKGFDDSVLWEVFEEIRGEKIIVIKSTVLPGSTDNYQERFPQHKILINPEFLVAKTATQDFLKPARQILGYTKFSKDVAKDIMDILPLAPFKKIVKANEAEMIKYFGNIFLANKVIFANQMYNFCQKAGIDYEVVRECAVVDHRTGHSHFNVFHDNYRGYGGMCLPKDIKAFIDLAESLGIEPKLFKILEEINKILRNEDEKK